MLESAARAAMLAVVPPGRGSVLALMCAVLTGDAMAKDLVVLAHQPCTPPLTHPYTPCCSVIKAPPT